MDAQFCGKWQKFFKKGLSLITADLGDMINVFQYGPEITPRVKQTAGSTEKYQQHQQPANLQFAFQQEPTIVSFGDQNRQGMRLDIAAGGHEGLRKAHEGKLCSGESRESLPEIFFRQQFIRYKAEAICGIGQKPFRNIQPLGGIRQDTGQTVDAGGLSVVRGEVGLVYCKAAQAVGCAICAQHRDGEKNGPL